MRADFFYINNGLTALGLSPFPSTTVSPLQPQHTAVSFLQVLFNTSVALSAYISLKDLYSFI